MSPPRVSVTIPTYNRAHLLGDTIRSVLEQSVDDLELFVSDNASTDRTRQVVESIDDPRLHYAPNPRNIGLHPNLSRGFGLGSAPFVYVLPDDDRMLPGNLERKLALAGSDPEIDIVHGASRLEHVDEAGRQIHAEVYRTGGSSDHVSTAEAALRRLLTSSYWINFPTAVIRRSIVGEVRFEARDDLADDLGMFMRLCRNARKVAYVSQPLVALRMHTDAHSTKRGFHGRAGDAFVPDITAVAHITRARRRFLQEHGNELGDTRALRSGSRAFVRGKLLWILKRRVQSDGPRAALPLLRQAVAVEPSLLLDREVSKLWLKALTGPRGSAWLSQARRRVTRARG